MGTILDDAYTRLSDDGNDCNLDHSRRSTTKGNDLALWECYCAPMKTIVLLTISNIFMNLAWYGHLKFKNQALWLMILISWGVALFEYIFQVPANRIGSTEWSVPQLKILQECITLVVFTVVAFVLFGSSFKWNYLVSYGFIVGAVFFAFRF